MITANDIVKANEVLKNVVERTPLDFDRYLSENTGRPFILKKKICKGTLFQIAWSLLCYPSIE